MKQTIEELLTADVAIEIASHEAIIRSAYKDSEGVWTWSVGLTSASGHRVERYKDNPQTLEYSLGVYVWALRRYAQEVLDAFKGYDLTLAQFAGALSFHWNTGAIDRATWVKTVKAGGNRDAAYQQFLSWNKPAAIRERRAKEAELFFNGKWSNDGKMTEYTRLTKSYTPVWGSAKRIDVSHTLSKLLAPVQEVPETPIVEAPAIIETPADEPVLKPVKDYPVDETPKQAYSFWDRVKRFFVQLFS